MFDEKSFVQILIAMGGGVIAALASHFNLRSRVNTLKSDSVRHESDVKELREQVSQIAEDTAFMRGKMTGESQ